jgi:hypothetical protein
VRHRLFEPLHIAAVTKQPPDHPGWLQGRLNNEQAPDFDFPVFLPAGASWRMTISALHRWASCHLNPPDNIADAVALALRPHYKGRGRVVGLGWGKNALRTAWVHFGGTVGFRCFVAVDHTHGVALAVAASHNQQSPLHALIPRLRAFDRVCARTLRRVRKNPAA